MNGWIILDKPLGMTSTKASSTVRKLFKAKKAGHAGTLDPLATGVLPIALGEATKAIPYIVSSHKSYSFRIIWGEARATDDAEGEIIATSAHRPSLEDLQTILPQFIGNITQIPPQYSAIRIQGKRAYDLARAGEHVDMPSRQVMVYDLRITHVDAFGADLEVDCGEGTYVRSLARDISLSLGTYGYVGSLRRLRVGPFSQNETILLEKLQDLGHNSKLSEVLLPIGTVLDDIPAVPVSEVDCEKLTKGQRISAQDYNGSPGLVALWGEKDVVALAEFRDNWFYPKRLFLNT